MKEQNTIKKSAKLFIAALSFFVMTAFGQNKTFTGTLEDYTCGDERCSFGIKKADGNFFIENITLEYDASGKPKLEGDFQDLILISGDNESLNPKYKGKKVTLTCSVKNNIYYVQKIENSNKPIVSEDNFIKATCKVYRAYNKPDAPNNGRLESICENMKVYRIRDGQKKDEKPIQNKNEICRGSKCVKVKVDAQGFILVYNLPNTTEARVLGKIVGDKIYTCNGKDDKELNIHATFKGDKNQAALIAVYEGFY